LQVKASVGEGGESVDKRGQGGQTPIIHAILNGKDDVVEFLLFAGANLALMDDTGFLPMHAAALSGRERCIRMLAAFGCDPSEKHRDG
jgi:ankyrin repeat protein